MKRNIVKNKTGSIPMSTVFGFVVATVISVIGAAIAASFLLKETFDQTASPVLASLIQFIASLLGCSIACKRAGQKFILTAASTAVAYLFALVVGTVLVFDGGFRNLGMSLLAILLGGAIACTTCLMKRREKHHKARVHC